MVSSERRRPLKNPNGMSPEAEKQMRETVRRMRRVVGQLVLVMDAEEWDFAAVESLVTQLSAAYAYLSTQMARGIGVLTASGQMDRLLGMEVGPFVQMLQQATEQDGPVVDDAFMRELIRKALKRREGEQEGE